MIKIENRFFFISAFLMALVVALSNYLVQFPVNYIGLQDIFTYGAFSYPIAFLITDLTNRRYGKIVARKIVYIGFILGVTLTLYFSTDFSNLISKRIAIGSGTAFLIAQLLDVQVFDRLRKKRFSILIINYQAFAIILFLSFFTFVDNLNDLTLLR